MTARSRRVLGGAARVRLDRSRLAGCARGCTSSRPPIHLNPSMDDQPKVRPQTASAFFYDGQSMRQPVPGTVADGELHEDAAFFTGKDADGQFVATIPVAVDEAVRRAGPAALSRSTASRATTRAATAGASCSSAATSRPPSFHQDKVLNYPDGQIFDVITNGVGLMPAYRWPIPPADRWAIIAHVRGLQRERQARAASAPAAAARSGGHARAARCQLRRPRRRRTVDGGSSMNGVANRKLLFVLGPVTGLVMFGAVVLIATFLTNREYREPYRAPAAMADPTPRAAGLEAERAAAEATARAKPVRRGRVPRLPRRREPRGHLGRWRSSTCCSRPSSWPSRSSR